MKFIVSSVHSECTSPLANGFHGCMGSANGFAHVAGLPFLNLPRALVHYAIPAMVPEVLDSEIMDLLAFWTYMGRPPWNFVDSGFARVPGPFCHTSHGS